MTTRSLRNSGAAAFALSITFGLVAVLAAPPASARDLTVTAPAPADVHSAYVSTAGLDLADSGDLRRLQSRIRAASREVCAPLSIGKLGTAERMCRTSALDSAAPQVARLTERAQQLAAAGRSSRIVATVAVVAGGE